MKFKKIILSLIMAVVFVCTFTACGENSKGFTATFKYNYDGAPADYTCSVEVGQTVEPPADPVRDKFKFNGWFNESSCKNPADFEYAVTSDMTYYAGWLQTSATITFNYNYAGATSATATVDVGGKATQPTAPEREGFVFDGWYKEAACTNEFSFDTQINADIEIFAKWEESAGDTVKVTFSYNYDGAGDYYTQTINSGRRITKPADPVRTDGYAFINWYQDEACTQLFNFNTFLNQNTTIYAKWSKIHTFEAEYVNMTGMVGVGWSSSVEGLGLIDKDEMNGGASNGFFVGYMYVTGNTLTFNIDAAEAVSDCVLVLRLTAEGEEGSVVRLTDKELLVKVNDTDLSFTELIFEDIPDINGGTRRPFTNHVINTAVSLQKGKNVIKLIVNNTKSMGGTMNATAPMFDCMYLYTNTELSWTEGECYTSNIKGM